VRAIVDNDFKIRRDSGDLTGGFLCTGISYDDTDAAALELKRFTCLIDIAADDRFGPREIFVPYFERPSILHAYFKKSNGLSAKWRKKAFVLMDVGGPLINNLSLVFGKDLLEGLHSMHLR